MNEKTRHHLTPSNSTTSSHDRRKALLEMLRTSPDTLFIAADVGTKKWFLAAAGRGSERPTQRALEPFDTRGLLEWIPRLRKRHGLDDGPVVFAYEAGRDGFSIARVLEDHGVHCLVVDPGSIETSSRARVAKTDRLDAKKLLVKLRNYVAGDRSVFVVARIPSREVEDYRRPVRERERLVKERTGHQTRIRGLLATVGLQAPSFNQDFATWLRQVRTPDGRLIQYHLRREILRELERLELVEAHVAEIERQLLADLDKPTTLADKQGATLRQLVSCGLVTATLLSRDFFWRDFRNRKEVASAAGFDGTPRATGHTMDEEQGISKAGSKRVRVQMIELAWGWIRLQPDSAITKWFYDYIDGTKRAKRKAIVAVARRLLIALWRFAVHGVIPEGARFKEQAA